MENTAQHTLLPGRTLKAADVLPFLPEPLRDKIPRRVTVRIPAAVRRRLRTKERVSVSEWAARHRQVTAVDAHPGPWMHEFAPHTVKVMDTFGLPWVREVWFCAIEQSGKTNTMLNCLAWAADIDPGNAYYLMPTEDAAGKLVGKKLIPMFQESRPLARLLSKAADDTTRGLITLTHGMSIFPAHANSATSMATFSAKYCFGDEVDKYPVMAGKETDPLTLIKKRWRQNRGRHKGFFASTAAGMYIHKGMNACHQVLEWRMRCPDCNALVYPDAQHLDIPEGATVESIEREPAAVHLACPECGSLWDESAREEAIRQGQWMPRKGADIPRPSKVGFHHRAFECLDIPLVEIAGAYVKSQTGDLAAKIAWANGYLAEDYVPEIAHARETDHILRYTSGLPRNAVPLGTYALGLLVDTQQDHFYYQVWAYGYAPEIDMTMIRHGTVQTFDDLAGFLYNENFTDADGREHTIAFGMIDSGGTKKNWQKHSRTVEVYEWCRLNRIMSPIKGVWTRGVGRDRLLEYKDIDTYPGTNKRIPGGVKLVKINVDAVKDELGRILSFEPDDPGALKFHDEIDDKFAGHYAAEYKDETTGEWVHDRKRGRNDHWDCTVYALALREMRRLRIPRQPEVTEKPEEPEQATPMEQMIRTRRPGGRKSFVKGWK